MKKQNYFTLLLSFFLISSSCCSQNIQYTEFEKSSVNLFNEFTNHLKKCIKNKVDITDSVQLQYALAHYLFVNSKLETTNNYHNQSFKLTYQQSKKLEKQLNTFYRFLMERESKETLENLTAIPIRLSSDTFIYNRLTSFQKENTFVFYDKRYSKQTLGYILFMPPINNITSTPKIWSWTLIFKFGKFIFESTTGEEGYEYLFSPNKD